MLPIVIQSSVINNSIGRDRVTTGYTLVCFLELAWLRSECFLKWLLVSCYLFRSTNISTLENDKQIFERPPEMLDLPEHQFPQKNLSIIDDVEAGTSLDIQETMIRNDGEQRSASNDKNQSCMYCMVLTYWVICKRHTHFAADNNTSNLKLQSSRVSNTSKSLQSTPERFRRKYVL